MLLNALEEVAGNPTLTDRRYSPTMRQEYHRLRNLLPSTAFDWSILPEHHLSARPWARLREFEVYGDIRSAWMILVLPLMPSLTRLKIRTIDGFLTIISKSSALCGIAKFGVPSHLKNRREVAASRTMGSHGTILNCQEGIQVLVCVAQVSSSERGDL